MYIFPLYGILMQVNTTFLEPQRLRFLEKMAPENLDRFSDKVQLNIHINDYECSFGLYKEENKYIYKLPGCCYIIGIGYIDVFCTDIDMFLETFINVPMSIYITFNRLGLLLHSSSVEKDGQVVAFSGKKKIGKSTILQSIIKHNELGYTFYSDDTLRIQSKASVFPSLPIIKSEEPLDIPLIFRTSNGKGVYLIDNGRFNHKYESPHQINRIIFLRDRSADFACNSVSNYDLSKLLICQNVSGYSIFTDELKQFAYKFVHTIDNIDCYLISFPNDISSLSDSLKNIL